MNGHNGRRQFPGHASKQAFGTPPADKPIETKFGHNGQRVLMMFSRQVDNINLTEEQAESYLKNLSGALDMLRQHKAGQQAAPVEDTAP